MIDELCVMCEAENKFNMDRSAQLSCRNVLSD